jgi:hypothetical protein
LEEPTARHGGLGGKVAAATTRCGGIKSPGHVFSPLYFHLIREMKSPFNYRRLPVDFAWERGVKAAARPAEKKAGPIGYAPATGLVRVPICATVMLTVSPGRRNTGGVR